MVNTITAIANPMISGMNVLLIMAGMSKPEALWMVTMSGSPGLKRLPPAEQPSTNVAPAMTGCHRAASIMGMSIGPTAAAEAVWLVIAILVKKPMRQPPGTNKNRMVRMGAMSKRTMCLSAPMVRNKKA